MKRIIPNNICLAFTALALACFALLPSAQARLPSPTLGVTRAEIQNVLEAQPFQVLFKDAPLNTGESRMMGTKESADAKAIAIIELIGPPDNLREIDCNVATGSAAGAVQNAAILLTLVKKTLPEWNQGPDWVNAALAEVARTGEARTTFREVKIRLKYLKTLGLVSLSISSHSPQTN